MTCTFYGALTDFRSSDYNFGTPYNDESICLAPQASDQYYQFPTNHNASSFEDQSFDGGQNLLHIEVGDEPLGVPFAGKKCQTRKRTFSFL